MSTRKNNKSPYYKSPKNTSSGKDTFVALLSPTYPRNKNKTDELDIKIRTLTNYFRNKEQDGINATWKEVTPVKRSSTVSKNLNNLKCGRKQKGTKKKRRNKTKKRVIKNQRK